MYIIISIFNILGSLVSLSIKNCYQSQKNKIFCAIGNEKKNYLMNLI